MSQEVGLGIVLGGGGVIERMEELHRQAVYKDFSWLSCPLTQQGFRLPALLMWTSLEHRKVFQFRGGYLAFGIAAVGLVENFVSVRT